MVLDNKMISHLSSLYDRYDEMSSKFNVEYIAGGIISSLFCFFFFFCI